MSIPIRDACSIDGQGHVQPGVSDPILLRRGRLVSRKLDISHLPEESFSPLVVYFDGGRNGWGASFTDSTGKHCDFYGAFDKKFTGDTVSSTSRELVALLSFLEKAGESIAGLILVVRGDSKNAISCIQSPEENGHQYLDTNDEEAELCRRLKLCHDIEVLRKKFYVKLQPEWIPREQNQRADYLSKKPYFDNFAIPKKEFDRIITTLRERSRSSWGPPIIDRFPSKHIKQQLLLANSPDAFSSGPRHEGWTNSINYAFPPPDLVVRTVEHARKHKAKMILVVFKMLSALWWPVLRLKEDGPWMPFVMDLESWSPNAREDLEVFFLRCDFSTDAGQDARIYCDDQLANTLRKSLQKVNQLYIAQIEIKAEISRDTADGQAIVRSSIQPRMEPNSGTQHSLLGPAVEEDGEDKACALDLQLTSPQKHLAVDKDPELAATPHQAREQVNGNADVSTVKALPEDLDRSKDTEIQELKKENRKLKKKIRKLEEKSKIRLENGKNEKQLLEEQNKSEKRAQVASEQKGKGKGKKKR